MKKMLLERLFDAKDQPKPRFAFLGTVNWMRALSLLADNNAAFKKEKIRTFYQRVQRRSKNVTADTVVLENMLLAYHNHVALKTIVDSVPAPYDLSLIHI